MWGWNKSKDITIVKCKDGCKDVIQRKECVKKAEEKGRKDVRM